MYLIFNIVSLFLIYNYVNSENVEVLIAAALFAIAGQTGAVAFNIFRKTK